MRRREFLGAFGGAAVWPLVARAPAQEIGISALSLEPRSLDPVVVADHRRRNKWGCDAHYEVVAERWESLKGQLAPEWTFDCPICA